MNKELKFPEGSIIEWCDEYFLVEKNNDDYIGIVRATDGYLQKHYFTYAGEESVLITDEKIIKRVHDLINEALVKREYEWVEVILDKSSKRRN